MGRRPWLAALGGAAIAGGLGGIGLAAAAQPALAADAAAVEVEAGVYMVPGQRGAPATANEGRVGNTGFIVGRSGVLAVDAGISFAQGDALLAAIAQVTALPVKALLITSAHQEFLFGAGAFQARGVPVHMHREAARLMNARCAGCLKTLQRELGETVMQGTAMFKPDVVFDQTHVIESIGRPVLVQHHGHSSGPGDVNVFDVRSGSLFAGSLLDEGRVPDIQDSELPGWHQALAAVRTLRINTAVPGHGRAGGPELLGTVGGYLTRLERRVAGLLAAGTALSEVPDAAALPEYQAWDQYEIIHRRNASILFLRMEGELLRQPPARRP